MRAVSLPEDPHKDSIVLTLGASIEAAKAAVILLHGRGSNARDMTGLFEELGLSGVAALIPEASGNTWYPYSFLAPLEQNQPYLDSALSKVQRLIKQLETQGVAPERIALLGFSQGACLASEFVARYPRRYGALVALTGGVIGPPGTHEVQGSLDGTPVFLGTSDPDPHVPIARVEETAALFRAHGARVTVRKYPGMPHSINQEEIEFAKRFITDIPEDI